MATRETPTNSAGEVTETGMSETNTEPMTGRSPEADPYNYHDKYWRCGRRDRCGLPAGWGTNHCGVGACKLHGGASTGPTDTAYLEGNDHAAGNPGGGPPKLNTNAEDSGAYADWRKAYERLDAEARESVDELAEAALSRVREHTPDLGPGEREKLALEYAVLLRLSDRADVAFHESTERDGPGDFEKTASVLGRATEISARRRVIGRKLRLWPGVRDEDGSEN